MHNQGGRPGTGQRRPARLQGAAADRGESRAQQLHVQHFRHRQLRRHSFFVHPEGAAAGTGRDRHQLFQNHQQKELEDQDAVRSGAEQRVDGGPGEELEEKHSFVPDQVPELNGGAEDQKAADAGPRGGGQAAVAGQHKVGHERFEFYFRGGDPGPHRRGDGELQGHPGQLGERAEQRDEVRAAGRVGGGAEGREEGRLEGESGRRAEDQRGVLVNGGA